MVYRGRHYSESSSESDHHTRSRSRSRESHSHSSSSHRRKGVHEIRNHSSRERDTHRQHVSSNESHHQRQHVSSNKSHHQRQYASTSESHHQHVSSNESHYHHQYSLSNNRDPDFDNGDDFDSFAIDTSESHYTRSTPQKTSLLQHSNVPPLYSIHKGTVRRTLDFGSFVNIPPYSFDGLIHVDQYIPDLPAPKPGDSVYVKVMKVYESEGKIKMSLSLKECNQKTGKDLNPKNQHDEGYFADDGGIQVGSIRKTVCQRCGMTGHVEWECYVDLKNKELYTLVSDEEEPAKQKHHRHRRHHHHK